MSNFVLMTDSCCDLSAAMADELNLSVLPLSVIQEGKEYRNFLDNRELDPKEFYARLREGAMGSTSAINFKVKSTSTLTIG